MAIGSFNGLYTFQDVAKIYNMDNSTLRKQVSSKKLIEGKEVKKFGKTWLITEQAMVQHFGSGMLQLYNKELTLKQVREENIKAIKRTQNKVNVNGSAFLVLSISRFLRSFHIGGILWIRYTANALDAMKLMFGL